MRALQLEPAAGLDRVRMGLDRACASLCAFTMGLERYAYQLRAASDAVGRSNHGRRAARRPAKSSPFSKAPDTMNSSVLAHILQNPSILISRFVFDQLLLIIAVYTVVWLVTRPGDLRGFTLGPGWHIANIGWTVAGAAVLRLAAIGTFAGNSAFEVSGMNGAAMVYLLLFPALAAVLVTQTRLKSLRAAKA